MAKRYLEGRGPCYDSWDEAMADPELDLGKPWFVVTGWKLPPNVFRAPEVGGEVRPALEVFKDAWSSGWKDIGSTRDGLPDDDGKTGDSDL
jgi:hypothetical protein